MSLLSRQNFMGNPNLPANFPVTIMGAEIMSLSRTPPNITLLGATCNVVHALVCYLLYVWAETTSSC